MKYKIILTIPLMLLLSTGCTLRTHQIQAERQQLNDVFIPKKSPAKCYLFFRGAERFNFTRNSVANICPVDTITVTAEQEYKRGITEVFSLFFDNMEVANFPLSKEALFQMKKDGASFYLIADVRHVEAGWYVYGTSFSVQHKALVDLIHEIEFYNLEGARVRTLPVSASFEYTHDSWMCQEGADAMQGGINNALKLLFDETIQGFSAIY